MQAYQLKVLRELIKKPPVPRAVAERHGDIEDAVEQNGGRRGSAKTA